MKVFHLSYWKISLNELQYLCENDCIFYFNEMENVVFKILFLELQYISNKSYHLFTEGSIIKHTHTHFIKLCENIIKRWNHWVWDTFNSYNGYRLIWNHVVVLSFLLKQKQLSKSITQSGINLHFNLTAVHTKYYTMT